MFGRQEQLIFSSPEDKAAGPIRVQIGFVCWLHWEASAETYLSSTLSFQATWACVNVLTAYLLHGAQSVFMCSPTRAASTSRLDQSQTCWLC